MAVVGVPRLANRSLLRRLTTLNKFHTNVALRTATAMVVLFAWVVLSNHCALALMFPVKSSAVAVAEASCCKGQPEPADGDGPCPQMPQGCCKSLKVTMPDAAKIPLATVAPVILFFSAFVLVVLAESSPQISGGPPPDSPTFAELVLNRSLLSHAPPATAS